KPGSSVTKEASKPAPTLSISRSITKSAAAKYIAVALDLDAPVPSMALASPVLHGIQANLGAQGEPDAGGWVKLVPDVPPIASYAPPNPPFFSASHRYIFLVWEQPEGLTNEKIKKELGLVDEVGLGARVRWDQDACEKKLGLGKALGGNYF
ncbi:uncharacterized protein BDR25DRAFT_156821, partial [Lindgomyces ingoldianus]